MGRGKCCKGVTKQRNKEEKEEEEEGRRKEKQRYTKREPNLKGGLGKRQI